MNGRSHHPQSRSKTSVRILAFALAAIVACQSPKSGVVRPDQVRRALDAGNYIEAERLAAEWVTTIERVEGAESLATGQALDLLVEASVKNGTAGTSPVLLLAERAVRLKEHHLGRDTLDTASSLHNLGIVRLHRGEFSSAVPPLERSLSIRTTALGRNDPVVADSLDALALSLIRLEQFDDAAEKLREAQSTREFRSDHSPLALARTLELMALRHRYTDSYSAAVPLIDRALEIRHRVSPNHPDAVFALQTRGDVLMLMGDSATAQRNWASALDLSMRLLRPDHPAIAETLFRLSIAAASSGDLSEARRLAERARDIGERSLAPCEPTRPMLEVAVADILRYDGDYAEARKLYRSALDKVQTCAGVGGKSTWADAEATLVFNEAGVARDVGDLSEAGALYERAVDIWSRGLGPDHSFVARGLDAVAEVAASRGQLSKAHTIYERALAIRRRSLGADHPHVAWTLTNLAKTEAEMGNVSIALRYVQDALAIYQKSGAADEPDHVARVLELRGILEQRLGRLPAASESLQLAVDERTRIFGPSHPLVAETRAALAAVDFARGDRNVALQNALEAERLGREHLLFTVRYLPERQAMTYATTRPKGLDLAVTIVATSTTDPSPVLDAVIRSRGVILDEFAAARRRATSTADPRVAALATTATLARQRVANLVVRSLQEPVSRDLLEEARKQKDDAERALAERNLEARAELTRGSAGLNDISRALPSGGVLVSFVRYERARLAADGHAGRAPTPRPFYAALVLRAGSAQVNFVPLSSAEVLEPIIEAWRGEASGRSILAGAAPRRAEQDYFTTSTRLRRALWDPLTPHIAGAERIFVVPDGLINLVNIAALSDDHGYLVERYPLIHYLATERDLLVSAPRTGGASALLAVGGAAFDELVPSRSAASVQRGPDCESLARVHFEALPGSLNEISDISSLWPKTKPTDVTILSGPAATESAVKRAVAGHRVVHLATHGFFLDSDCAPTDAGRRAVGGIARSSAVASVAAENPLLLTGLVLAGANNRGKVTLDQDEGILTAEEIAGLNLEGTEWAVLSACDTGLGEIKAGEGVFGLRRAFQIAGARTVIMSLWSVEDTTARVWMRALYEGRLRRNLDTAAAVREASLSVLRARRAGGQSTHPFHWAAFVAAGDWR
jgi:CHAT domain-containing protein/tetratricopeptide (TPR) repeat protein